MRDLLSDVPPELLAELALVHLRVAAGSGRAWHAFSTVRDSYPYVYAAIFAERVDAFTVRVPDHATSRTSLEASLRYVLECRVRDVALWPEGWA